jgi:uroporphyrinogen decarboxylase
MRKFQPDFNYLLSCLKREPTERPVLFEFYMNDNVYNIFTEGVDLPNGDKDFTDRVRMMLAFCNMGYDFATMLPPEQYRFPIIGEHHTNTRTYSLNEGSHIDSWEAFESYPWPNYSTGDYRYLEKVFPYIPEGMKLIPSGPGGMEEIVISLTGYENLCFLMIDNPELVDALFEAVGSRLVSYYRDLCTFDEVGACISNDDWGFNTQTLLSPQQMQRWVFPWHQKIADTIHASGKPAVLHSCGNIYPIFDWVTDRMKYEGKHSYEDSILPVEDAWERYHDKIAIMGGIDVNYMIMESEKAVYERSSALLERTQSKGAFALGTGNSVPDYLPTEKFIAMLKAAWERRS